ncbi:hypothetical protein ABT337_31980 [Saccharopolyspora hirsuta]|uniref:Uncharacterized protein n=1 Tax=Saccharopolyspora hirsuta TaxID=1837 RepID=A0A5M7BPN9_SACHI|nr:hypothetical protein [Saccharopolyspora hirsuta]KAA5829121.1 hypothetical protein F1721_25965 [Saccharopolyspora hirsuta]
MTRRWPLVLTGVLVALVAAGIPVWWWFALPGQQRRVVEPMELVDVPPPVLPGPWQHRQVDSGRLPSDWGAQAQATAAWQRPDGVEIDYTVRRYASSRWAHWAFDRVDRHGSEMFDETLDRPPALRLADADEARYVCGEIRGRPFTCDNWWIDLRYGQYLVQLQSTDAPSDEQSIPPWLAELVRTVDAELTSEVPRQ